MPRINITKKKVANTEKFQKKLNKKESATAV